MWRVKTFYSEEKIIVQWLKSISNKDVILAIGANIGIYSILSAVNAKLVYACEFDLLNTRILKENIYLNKKVIILHFQRYPKIRYLKFITEIFLKMILCNQ